MQFSPNGNTSVLAATSPATNPMSGSGPTARIAVTGSAPVFIAFGDASVVATYANAIPFFPNTPESITLPRVASHMSCFTESGTSRVAVTLGVGD